MKGSVRYELGAAREWTWILAPYAPLVVDTLKEFSIATLNESPAEIGAPSRDQLLTIRDSEDGKESGRAFAEKRNPVFTGR
jgi:hypothetical protein